jgi:hypothetical protein
MMLCDFVIDNQTNKSGCLVDSELYVELTMNAFDELPYSVRKRMSESPYKLCTLCVAEHSCDEYELLSYIELMENEIKIREGAMS